MLKIVNKDNTAGSVEFGTISSALHRKGREREVVVVFLEGVNAKNDAVHWVQNYGTVKMRRLSFTNLCS